MISKLEIDSYAVFAPLIKKGLNKEGSESHSEILIDVRCARLPPLRTDSDSVQDLVEILLSLEELFTQIRDPVHYKAPEDVIPYSSVRPEIAF